MSAALQVDSDAGTVHLRQRRGQAADQAGPEQTRSKLFGYQPDPVGCHLILREQKPAERRPWRVRNVRRNCVWSAMYAGIACGPQGAISLAAAFAFPSPLPEIAILRLHHVHLAEL